jgi:hypothetical protein
MQEIGIYGRYRFAIQCVYWSPFHRCKLAG